jgi:succinoglycan biosynthesis transport protein ExoP
MVSVSILEPAEPPLGPIGQKKGLTIFLSFCIAGMAGLGLAFLLEYFDHTFKVPEDIKDNLRVPLLGTIEDLPTKEREDLETLAISPKPPLHYQILKSNIKMYAGEKGIKTLSICSPTPREGSSTVALNLAAFLAKDGGYRVVLVDANLRDPSLHTSSKLPASPGFSEVIHEGANVHEAIKESVIPNLFVLTSGISPPNPMVIFESPKLDELIEVLRREFDWIIFDCAPIDLYPESTVLTRRLNGVVLVIQAENKSADVAIRAKEQLEQAGAKILGAVLNRRRYVIPEVIYKRL